MTTFKNPHDPDNSIIRTKIQEWLREAMALNETSVVDVMEVDCADPGCMDKETRILLTNKESNTSKLLRVHKPLVYVRRNDIEYMVKNLK